MGRGTTWKSADVEILKSKSTSAAKSKPAKTETANQITANLIRAINSQPQCVAYRINNTGIWDEEKQVFRKAHTEPGLPDIIVIAYGCFAGIEVKAGKDRQSQHQQHRQSEIERAKGVYFIAHSTDEGLAKFLEFQKQAKQKHGNQCAQPL
jgi:hypothetical protein